jgi:hypothetical protein
MELYFALIALKYYTKPNNGGGGLKTKENCTYNVGLELRTQQFPASPQIYRPTGQTADVSTQVTQVTYQYH